MGQVPVQRIKAAGEKLLDFLAVKDWVAAEFGRLRGEPIPRFPELRLELLVNLALLLDDSEAVPLELERCLMGNPETVADRLEGPKEGFAVSGV